ncbi:MAG: hypothetical protein P8X89_05505 [Reinekea sp.]
MLPKNWGGPMGAPAIFEKQIEIKLLHSASTLESRIQDYATLLSITNPYHTQQLLGNAGSSVVHEEFSHLRRSQPGLG